MTSTRSVDALIAENTALSHKNRQLEQTLARQRHLLEAIHALSGEPSLDLLLGRIMEQATTAVDADRSSLFLYDRDRNELWSKIAQGLDIAEIRFSADTGVSGHVIRTGDTVNLPDAYADPRFNPEWDRKTGYRTRSMLVMPMVSRRGDTIGVLQVLNKLDGEAFTAADEEILGALATNAAAFVETARLHERIEELFEAFVRVSMSAIDERDPATSGHSARVAAYTMNLARCVHDDQGPRFGSVLFTREELRELRFAALLHDYGKIGVREYVLCKRNKLTDPEIDLVCQRIERKELEARLEALDRKARGEHVDEEALLPWLETLRAWREIVRVANVPDPLTDASREELDAMLDQGFLTGREHEALSVSRGNLTRAEWEDMRSHVTRTYHIVKQIPWPENLAGLPAIAWSHHERIDGSGYPRGLLDANIPLGARMMAIADTYDALIAADRSYKKALPHERACDIVRLEAAAGHLDPDLVELFIQRRAWDIGAEKPAVPVDAGA